MRSWDVWSLRAGAPCGEQVKEVVYVHVAIAIEVSGACGDDRHQERLAVPAQCGFDRRLDRQVAGQIDGADEVERAREGGAHGRELDQIKALADCRAVVRASIKGVIIVILLYTLLMAALAWTVPLSSLAGHKLALAGALEMAVSPLASTIVLVAAIVILMAHQNLLYMSTPRILQALAVDGLAVKRAGGISKGGNPTFAVLLSWGVAVGLIMISGFEFLLHLIVFFYLFLYVLVIAGVVILRVRQPDTDRPYRAWGHPWSTWACLAGWLLLGLFQVFLEIETAAYAAIMVAVAWPAYRLLVRREPQAGNKE